ncbi:MAG: phosphatidate cytidylyltransferase [candidate division KSB1 bacterium]|nr:phosphatidate cytidylyltransferase [candidate division KSB1 bacterium]MDZ7275794.1 phosphatidate cytidylyltransferase [candidate division KSB1 bacterium]MDZ7287546.1 phosphatidate cytidylyltransferase [candidate division KSB1 bacterium]MDZ7307972.1 phosphatidate cytidylyltransferase [candidate division KSB1 bacterium]MDZ7350524.1 phosphatidate cytidylyltransferase [candidate division KSB1 bacterium]
MDWHNLGQRVVVGLICIPLIVSAIWVGRQFFLLFIALVVGLGLYEFYDLARHKQARPQRWLGMAGGVALPVAIYFGYGDLLWLWFTAVVVALLVVELFSRPTGESGPLHNLAITVFGMVYVAGLLSFLVAIRELPRLTGSDYHAAGTWVIMIFAVIWICDTAAYFVGLYFGKRKLFARVSPKKTVAGAVGGFVFAILSALACQRTFVKELTVPDAVVIGVIIGVFGQMSDLVESLFKRDAGLKDSSNLIPGHGGILDRFDSEMLVAPLVYFYLLARNT